MGQALSAHVASTAPDGLESQLELEMIKALRAEQRRFEQPLQRWKSSRTLFNDHNGALRPIDVVDEEVSARINAEYKSGFDQLHGYIDRALNAPVQVDRVQCQVQSQRYDMPRVTTPCAPTASERTAFEKSYAVKGAFNIGRRLRKRHALVMQAIGQDESYLLVNSNGYAAAVVARNAFSREGLLGKRALLLLNVLKGLAEGYCKVCNGSGNPHAEAMREMLKREPSMRSWGLSIGATPLRWVPNGDTCTSGELFYRRSDGSETSFRFGSWIARREVFDASLTCLREVASYGLGDYIQLVSTYLEEVDAVKLRYRTKRRT